MIRSYAQIPVREETVVRETVTNWDQITTSTTLGGPALDPPIVVHLRLMTRWHSNGRMDEFFIPDDGSTALIEWKSE